MAKYQFKGLDEYAAYLQRIGANTQEICGKAVYSMADIVADKVRSNIEALPTVTEAEALAAYKGKRKAGLTSAQKKGLEEGFGISPMENDKGYWNVKLGFDGYNKVKTKTYPNGQPNAMIARSTESGSSVREKTPFIRTAVSATQKQAVEIAKQVVDKEISKIKE